MTVLSRNLYVGASFNDILLEQDPALIPVRVAETFGRIMATDFPARAEAIADEIAKHQPDLIGLQEVSLIRLQQPGDYLVGNPEPATLVAYDYLEILLQALVRRGTPYEAAVLIEHLDVELPMVVPEEGGYRLDDIRLTDRDVILVRQIQGNRLRIANPQAGHYSVNVVRPIGGGLEVLRGWCSVDVRTRGVSFRFLNTHLEDSLPMVRLAQAWELVEGPAGTALPVIAVGDFNTDGNGTGDDGYGLLLGAGFVDAWTGLYSADPGATCCQGELLVNETSELDTRVDLILYKAGGWHTQVADILGEDPADRTPAFFIPGLLLWPSDHAGVVGTLGLR